MGPLDGHGELSLRLVQRLWTPYPSPRTSGSWVGGLFDSETDNAVGVYYLRVLVRQTSRGVAGAGSADLLCLGNKAWQGDHGAVLAGNDRSLSTRASGPTANEGSTAV
jgi:hypothetical protein